MSIPEDETPEFSEGQSPIDKSEETRPPSNLNEDQLDVINRLLDRSEQILKDHSRPKRERLAMNERFLQLAKEVACGKDITDISDLEKLDEPNLQEQVKSIHDWLESITGYSSADSFEELVKNAPKDINRESLQSAFNSLKPLSTQYEDYDVRGYYITALADKVLADEFDRRFSGKEPSDEEKARYWDQEAKIELRRPQTGQYDKFREFGDSWRRGTLILRGDFGKDGNIGSGLRGGKVVVVGNVGSNAGALMMGGGLEITGNTGYGLGFGMEGGDIVVHGNVWANVGEKMHGGSIHVNGKVGRLWNGYGKTDGPNIGLGKIGGKIAVDGKEY